MRGYFFGNYYLSQIQQGIQALHCAVDMRNKYLFSSSMQIKMYDNWAISHKTVVLLNGGNQAALSDLHAFLDHPANPYPFGYFEEDEQSLNSCLTCIGIILPEKIYEGAALLRDRRTMVRVLDFADDGKRYVIVPVDDKSCEHEYTAWEVDLMKRLNEYRLA